MLSRSILVAVFLLVACKGGADDTDDTDTNDTDPVEEVKHVPTGVAPTAGGAVLTGGGYRLEIAVGAPQPMGTASDANHTLSTGPVRR